VLFETQAAVVMMDKLAGGSGGVGTVFHGREGDGATLTLDMAVAIVGPAGRGGAESSRVYGAFHGKGAGKVPPNSGRAAQTAGVAALSAARWARAKKRDREPTDSGGETE
jgi:hypothetical protein